MKKKCIVLNLIVSLLACSLLLTACSQKDDMGSSDMPFAPDADTGVSEYLSSCDQESSRENSELSFDIDVPETFFLSDDPYEKNKGAFELTEYETTGTVKKSKESDSYRFSIQYSQLPVTVPYYTDTGGVTLSGKTPKGGSTSNFEIFYSVYGNDNRSYTVHSRLCENWYGESDFYYIAHTEDQNYLVEEKFISKTENTEPVREESITLRNLADLSSVMYFVREYPSGVCYMKEETSSSSGEREDTYIYIRNTPTHRIEGDARFSEYEEAMQYIDGKLQSYGIFGALKTSAQNRSESSITPLLLAHRDGMPYDGSPEEMAGKNFSDILYFGTNSEYAYPGESEGTEFSLEKLKGTWDSADGKSRYTFAANELDVLAFPMSGADGEYLQIDLEKGKKKTGYYLFNYGSILLANNTDSEELSFSYTADSIMIDGIEYHKVDSLLANQLVGTWENEEEEISFDNTARVSYRGEAGIYAVLSETELLLSFHEGTVSRIPYSVKGAGLTIQEESFYKDGPKTGYTDVKEAKNLLLGTWVCKEHEDWYYVFNEDETYEQYMGGSSWLIGNPTREGIYRLVNTQDVKVYQDFAEDFYSEFELAGETLKVSDNETYVKYED